MIFMLQYREVTSPKEKSAIADTILRRLPDWFGIEESTVRYINEAAGLYFLGAFENGEPVGFLTITENFPCTCEIHVMGILPSLHRKGIGRELVEQSAGRYRDRGFNYMTVKTVAEPVGDAEYASTRAFYKAVGFLPLDIFPTLWDERNPCLFLCKLLKEPEV
jgi:GNAT superfamily N-acetyltransferase